jgi:hypothetical protein
MRSTEFDMVAMFLMALGVIFTCGVLLLIGLSKANSIRKPTDPTSPGSESAASSERFEGPVRAAAPQQRDRAAVDRSTRAYAGQH